MPLGHEFGLARENWAASGRVRHATSRQANAEMRFKPDRPLELSTFPSEISLPNFLEKEREWPASYHRILENNPDSPGELERLSHDYHKTWWTY